MVTHVKEVFGVATGICSCYAISLFKDCIENNACTVLN